MTAMKKICLMLALVMFTLMVTSAGAVTTATDMYDRPITLEQPAQRIVALTAADCEILCALGMEDALVGRGEYCNYPASVLDKPMVQSGAETNVEEILMLNPQLVLMGDMAQDEDVVHALENAGIAVAVSNADTIEGMYEAIAMIGALTGKEAEATQLIADLQQGFAEVSARCQNQGKTVYFEVSPLQWGLWTAGTNTFMDEIAAICGLTNAFADVEGWAAISEEQVLSRNPDYIVTITMYFGEGPTPQEEIMARTGWEQVTAVKNAAIFLADSDSVSRPGPRLLDAAKALADFIGELEQE